MTSESAFLDIDLDFFLNQTSHSSSEGKRLSSNYYKPWKKEAVISFLEQRCGLRKTAKIPGRFVPTHDKAIGYWASLMAEKHLQQPFKLVHVDGHADLGLGGDSAHHIMIEFLRLPVSERPAAMAGHVNEGNFLAYALACRWLSSVSYIHPQESVSDLHAYHFEGGCGKSGIIRMRCVDRASTGGCHRHWEALAVEPPVPFRAIPHDRWVSDTEFSHALLCHSPRYTPNTSDSLIQVFYDYIDFY